MRNNKELLDEDLLLLIHQGNVSASAELFDRYKYYSWRVAYDFHHEHPASGIELEDYHQIAFATLPKAMKSYTDFSCGFYGYWKAIAENEMIDYLIKNSYQDRYSSFGNSVHLDEEKDDGTLICEEIGVQDRGAMDKIFKEELTILTEAAIESFKKEEDRLIINLFLQGCSLVEIDLLVQANPRHIKYIISRFQKAMQNILKKW